MTHYLVLEVPATATAADIRRAYRRLVLLTHPDRTPDPAAHARYLAVNAAYEVLSDPSRRSAYDAALRTSAPPAAPGVPSGRARDEAARRAGGRSHRRTGRSPSAPFAAEYARFLRVARPFMLGALLLCSSFLLDMALAHEHPETVVSTDALPNREIVHYTDRGRFSLEEERLPMGTILRVTRTPLWRQVTEARVVGSGQALGLACLYNGSSNAFWLGLLLAAAISLWPQASNDVRLMATLMAVVCLILTASALLGA